MTKAVATWQHGNDSICKYHTMLLWQKITVQCGKRVRSLLSWTCQIKITALTYLPKKGQHLEIYIHCVSFSQRQCIDSKKQIGPQIMYILYLQWRAHFTGVGGQSLQKPIGLYWRNANKTMGRQKVVHVRIRAFFNCIKMFLKMPAILIEIYTKFVDFRHGDK